jgi:hypothetical protein
LYSPNDQSRGGIRVLDSPLCFAHSVNGSLTRFAWHGLRAPQDDYAAGGRAVRLDDRPTEERSAFFRALKKARKAIMPRYFFNIMEGRTQNLVRDIEGALLSGAGEAREEAVGLARDITRHGIHEPTRTWTVIVTDEKGDEVLTVPLSGTLARKTPFDLGNRIAKFESSLGRGTIVWLIGAAVLAITVQTAITTMRPAEQRGSYQTASAPTQGSLVAVRFAPQASMADITEFLDAYQASLAGGPRPGNLYRLRIGETTLPQAELAKIVARMTQEKVVEFAAAVQ